MVGQRGQVVHMNRTKVISETSKSLAQDVIKQLIEQIRPVENVSENEEVKEKQDSKHKPGGVTVFR